MNLPSVKGLRQFLDPEQQRAWLEGETDLARRRRALGIPRTALQIRRPLREAASPAAGAGRPRHPPPLRRNLHPHPAHDRALLLVGVLPALDLRQAARPRQCELDGAVHAAARRRRPPRALHPASVGFHHGRIARARPSRPRLSRAAASSGPKTSAMSSGEARTSSSSRSAAPPRSAPSSPTPARSAPSATSTSPT